MPIEDDVAKSLHDIAYQCAQLITALAERDAEIVRLRAALDRIADPLGCGCKPCVGQCFSEEVLRVTIDAMRDEARAALAPQEQPK